MAVTPPRKTLASILQDDGVPSEGQLYLAAKGITAIAHMAYVAKDEAELIDRVTKPFEDGVIFNTVTYQLTGDAHVWHASILAAWEDCMSERRPPAMTPQPVAAVAVQNTQSSVPDKVPSCLKSGVWRIQIDLYEQSFTPNRVFPTEKLIGAEAVLARVLFENQVSKLYTPIKLGELLQARSFTATGNVNPVATRDKLFQKLGFTEDGTIELAPKNTWDPQSQWAVIDGLEAVLWTMIFCEYGSEAECTNWTAYFVKQARNRPHLESVKHVYDMAGWKLAMAMRQGDTFPVASKEILADSSYLQELFSSFTERKSFNSQLTGASPEGGRGRTYPSKLRPNPKGQRSFKSAPPPPPPPAQAGKAKGKGKGKPRTGDKRPMPQQDSDNPSTVCDNYNKGTCNRKNCRYAHKCSLCGKPNHTALDCWNKDK